MSPHLRTSAPTSPAPVEAARRGRPAAAVVLGLAAWALTGCSVHVSTGGDAGTELSGDKVAAIAEASLEKSVGKRPDVECPDSITLKVGETSRCTLTDPSTGTQYGMTASVKDDASDGSGLYFQVDQTPKP